MIFYAVQLTFSLGAFTCLSSVPPTLFVRYAFVIALVYVHGSTKGESETSSWLYPFGEKLLEKM